LAAVIIAFLSAIWIATRVSKTITEPLAYLIAATERITKNQDYTEFPVVQNQDEIGSLSRAFGEMVSQIQARDLGLQQLAYYDPITGLPNRHYFEERIQQGVGNALRYGTFCYLMMIDLDDFKIVNDKLGHHVGDLLLKDVGNKLSSTMRKNDSIFRIGGDEFAVIVENNSNLEDVSLLANKIINIVSTPTMLDGHSVKVGASVGISVCPIYATNTIELMSTADSAMYIAKAKGKNNYHFYQAPTA
jgi:diguanylate cyclase (GGDEF)-like protein